MPKPGSPPGASSLSVVRWSPISVWAVGPGAGNTVGRRPHRLAAQDTTLSRWQHGFESRWGHRRTKLQVRGCFLASELPGRKGSSGLQEGGCTTFSPHDPPDLEVPSGYGTVIRSI